MDCLSQKTISPCCPFKEPPAAAYLNTVIAGGDPPILHLHIERRVGELALGVGTRALLALELAADLQLQPPRVLLVEQRAHVEHGDGGGAGGPAYGV